VLKSNPADEMVSAFVDYEFPESRQAWNGLALVGEAPGAEEVRLGRPFVGRSGKLLDEIISGARIERTRSAIANVFRVRPPDNKIDRFFISKRAAKNQNEAIIEWMGPMGNLWCKAKYVMEINALSGFLNEWRPRIVIALGRTPFWALAGKNCLISNVGKVSDCRLSPGIPVIPTFHPSYILRGNWSKRPEWLQHFVFAAKYVAQK